MIFSGGRVTRSWCQASLESNAKRFEVVGGLIILDIENHGTVVSYIEITSNSSYHNSEHSGL